MKKEQEDTDKSYTDNANKVIQQVAEKQGLALVVRKVSRSRGPAPLFQIRLPASDQKQATGICHRLEAAGGACIVFKN